MTVRSKLQRLLEPVWNMLPSFINNETIHLRGRGSEKSYLEMAGDVIGYTKQFFESLWNMLPLSINNETIHLRGRGSEKDYLGGVVAVVAAGVCMALF